MGDVSYVHSDFPYVEKEFKMYNKYIMDEDIEEKLAKVNAGEMSQYQYINWWRPTDAMKAPIQKHPLCVLDRTSV